MTDEELLAVLDIPKEKQYDWLYNNQKDCAIDIEWWISSDFRNKELGDVAFRLRDEVISADLKNETCCWCESSYEVFLHVIGEENEKDEVGLDTWFSMYARPLHWVVTAIRAKRIAKEHTKE